MLFSHQSTPTKTHELNNRSAYKSASMRLKVFSKRGNKEHLSKFVTP